jgi:hypothetical protein
MTTICTLYVFYNIKVTVAPVHAMQWGTLPLTLNLATRCRQMVSFMPWLLHPQDPLNGVLGESHSQSPAGNPTTIAPLCSLQPSHYTSCANVAPCGSAVFSNQYIYIYS